jgi:hypothetical protein
MMVFATSITGSRIGPEKTAFRWLRRADAEICAPLLDAALSRKSTPFIGIPSGAHTPRACDI